MVTNSGPDASAISDSCRSYKARSSGRPATCDWELGLETIPGHTRVSRIEWNLREIARRAFVTELLSESDDQNVVGGFDGACQGALGPDFALKINRL